MLRWRRQLYQIHLMMTGGMVAMVVIIYVQFSMTIGFNPRMLIGMGVLIAAMSVSTYFMMMKWSEVLRSISTLVHAPTEETTRRLEKLLGGEGITFTRRSPDPSRSGFKTMFREVLEVGDLRMAILDNRGASVVFLGPVGRENVEEFERLKGILERAVEMA